MEKATVKKHLPLPASDPQNHYIIARWRSVVLVPMTNVKKTADRVKQFFDKNYPYYCRRAGARIDVKSPSMSGMPRAEVIGNPIEIKIIEQMQARGVIQAIFNSIRSCSVDSQLILFKRHIQGNSVDVVKEMINCENTSFHDKDRIALNEFADAFEVQAKPYLGKEADFHIYEEQNRTNSGYLPEQLRTNRGHQAN